MGEPWRPLQYMYMSCDLLNPYGEICSVYPSISMIVIGLITPILRQKMVLSAV